MIKKKLINNLFWLLFSRITKILGSLVVVVWVARYLGPGEFGILNYALAYSAFFMLFVHLGLNKIVIREVVKNAKLTYDLLGSAFGLKLIGALLAILAIFVSFLLIQTDSLTKTIILIISIGFLFKTFDVIDFFYQSEIASKYVVIARNSAFIIASLLIVYFIVYQYSLVYFAVANVMEVFLASIFLIIIYKKTGHLIAKWRFKIKTSIRLLKYSWPIAISAFLVTIHMKIDQVMIGNMLDTEQVGIYSAAVKLAESWYFIPAILVSTLMPYFVSIRETNKELYHFRLMQLYSLMFWIGTGIGVFILIFGDGIITLLFGEVYIEAYPALVLNIWNSIFVSQALARGIWLISENLQKYRLYGNLIIVNINILANLILIPSIGIKGAALATLITQALGTWVIPFLWKPLRKSTFDMIKSVNLKYLFRKYQNE